MYYLVNEKADIKYRIVSDQHPAVQMHLRESDPGWDADRIIKWMWGYEKKAESAFDFEWMQRAARAISKRTEEPVLEENEKKIPEEAIELEDDMPKAKLINVDIEKEMKKSFLDYSMSVIVSRALPDVRDGLKPVHRRILYTMYENGLEPNKPYRKCADTVGSVLGSVHFPMKNPPFVVTRYVTFNVKKSIIKNTFVAYCVTIISYGFVTCQVIFSTFFKKLLHIA
jgi:hypothetical protein